MITVNNIWTDEIQQLKKKSDNHAILTMSHKHRRMDANISHRMVWATQQANRLTSYHQYSKQRSGGYPEEIKKSNYRQTMV